MEALIVKLATPFLIILVFAVGAYEYGTHHPITAPTVYYSLDAKQNDQKIISVIENARKYIYFAVYEFTKDDIAEALIAAKEKGIDVEGITDKGNSTTPEEVPIIKELEAAGINVETQNHPDGIMHIKAVVTDNEYASGSYNWTESATVANDEVLEVGTDENTRAQYENILKKILSANKTATSTSAAIAAPSKIDYTQAKNYIGQSASVTGKVEQVYVSGSGTVFFDYCKSYKDCPFSAVVFADSAKNFDDISKYEGQTITVTGAITSYGGVPEIVVDTPSQISE